MKFVINISTVISIIINIYLVYDWKKITVKQEEIDRFINKDRINKTTWTEGIRILQKKIKEKNPILVNKKYYYINTWAAFCAPCIKEMPLLDSLAGTLNKDVAYLFVTEMSDKSVSSIIKQREYNLKNFIFINNMNDFISAICNEQGIKTKIYPMQLIISRDGRLLNYSVGAFENLKESLKFVIEINKLN